MYKVECIYSCHLCYKSFCLLLTQIQFCKSIHAYPSSYYKFDYIRLYFLYHKDVLKLENNISKYIVSDKQKWYTVLGNMHTNIIKAYILTNLSCKLFYLFLIQIQIHRSIHGFPSSYYKFGCNPHCLLHRRDVLKIKNDYLQENIYPL